MQKQTVRLIPRDGSSMNAYVVSPEGKGSVPALIVLQEAYGVNSHIRQISERLSAEGYLTISPELFHRTADPGFEAGYGDFDLVKPHFAAISLDGLTADLQAVFDWLQEQGQVNKKKIGSIGFCLGGRVSFVANAQLPLSAAVSYYGGNMPSVLHLTRELHGPHAFFWGGLDKHIPPEQIDMVIKSLNDAGKEFVNTLFSYADHGFNCDERPSFQPRAAKEAWAMTLAFLKNNLS
jgi:carboxymethylenebutenolidase